VKDRTIARGYASALLEVGERHGEAEAYGPPLRALADAFRADPRTSRFFDTPRISREARRDAVRRTLEGRAPERFVHFVLLLLEKGRQSLIPRIADEYQLLLDERSGQHRAFVTLAREPDDQTRTLIADRLSRLLGQRIRPEIIINPAILGGLIVRYGDRWLDASLRRHLVALKREMIHARLPGTVPASAQQRVQKEER
jgi:F-type H+-transporting ATPase subunit delta